jgi:hypothetical protein
LLDFFFLFVFFARYFFSGFFLCANFFLVFAQPPPQISNGPFLNALGLELKISKTRVPQINANLFLSNFWP